MSRISLAFSPCPNDIFIFFNFLNDQSGLSLDLFIEDINSLNQRVLRGEACFAKTSVITAFSALENYYILPVGSALGEGFGPKLVCAQDGPQPITNKLLQQRGVAVAGKETTSYLLLKYFFPDVDHIICCQFSEIAKMVATNEIGYGVIINESRLQLENLGLRECLDFGYVWREQTSLPLPLGCLVANRNLALDNVNHFIRLVRQSINAAYENKSQALLLAKKYAQEKDDHIIEAHIAHYVSSDTYRLSSLAKQSFEKIFKVAGPLAIGGQDIFFE